MSDIYKIIYLNESNISKILVFFGNNENEDLDSEFKKNPTNKIFENVFSDEEMNKIIKENVDVKFIKMKIYIDDTISTVKKKILLNDDSICFEEIYLFCKNLELLNTVEIYQNLTQNGKREITKNVLFQYLLNLNYVDFAKIENKEIYNYDDLIKLNLNDKKLVSNNSIGQKSLTTIKNYSYTVNPFQVLTFDSFIEKHADNIISTTNHYNLMNNGFILDNSIYVCLFENVIDSTSKRNLNTETTIKLYYPYLNELEIKDVSQFSVKKPQLIEKSKDLLNEKFIKNIENIELFYDVYKKRTNDIDYIEQGIKYIDFLVYPQYKLLLPLDVIFKLVSSNIDIPFIKYNPSNRQEKIYRLYCDKNSKNGKKIPYLSKNNIFKLAKTIGKNKGIAYNIINNKTNQIILEIDINGNIHIKIDFKKSESIQSIEKIIQESINPVILIIQNFLKKSGYSFNEFNNFYDENIEIIDINYFSYLSIDKNIQLYNYIGCVSSVFNVLISELKKGIVMRYKRVSNFNELDSQQAFIIELLNKSNYETDIVKGLMDNYQLSEDDAKLKIASLLDTIEIEQNLNKNRKLRVKNNPGFLTKITQDQFQNNIAIEVSNINDIYYLQTIPIYLDSLIRITQHINSSNVPESYIEKLCSTNKEEDIDDISDVIADPEKKYTESIPVSIVAQDLVFNEDVLNTDNNQSSSILDLLYDDDEEEEEEEDDDMGGGAPKLKIVDSTLLSKDVTGMSLNNPNPFFSKLLKRDPKLFLTKGDGKYNAYSRSCPWNIRRQPVILTDEEKEKIDKNHPGSYEHAIKYGSNPDKQYWYICPRYWDLKTNTSLTKEEVNSGKYGNVIPPQDTIVPKNANIFEFTDSKAHKDNKGNYIQHHPGFLKLDKHPDGLCVPCCFSTWDKGGQPERRKKCLENVSKDTGDNKSLKEVKKDDIDEYIKGPDKFPLEQNRWGYLPMIVQRFINFDNAKCYISKLNTNLKRDTLCLIRQGVENSKKKSFVACIADIYTYVNAISINKEKDNNETIKIDEFYDVDKMISTICNSLTLDNFITYQNGNLPQLFNNGINEEINTEEFKSSKLYEKLDKTDENIILFKKLVSSMKYFKDFLKDPNNIVDHTYLWDIICTPNPKLFKEGLNIIILEISQDDITNNIKVICPSNHFSNEFFNTKRKTILLIKKYEYYEPVYIIKDDSSSEKYKLNRLLHFNTLPQLNELFLFVQSLYINMCKPLTSINTITFSNSITINDTLNILKETSFDIEFQILNYDFKTIGLMVKRKNDCENIEQPTKLQKSTLNGFIPCYPSAVIDDIPILYFDNKDIWENYEETVYFLLCVKQITDNRIKCNPDFKIIDDGLIVGILTHTNQFIPLAEPEQNIYDDNIPTITNRDYLKVDKLIKNSDKIDNEREEYIEKIEIETNKYNDFRNLFKLLINKYENAITKKELENIIYSDYMLYIIKLENVGKILKSILNNNVIFTPYNKSEFNKKNKMLLIPNINLINKAENEKLYYGKLADEIIRYNRIKQFIFEPKIYLSFHNIKYNLSDNEIILLHSLLFSDYFIDLEPVNKNNFIQFNTFDTVNPIKTKYYSSLYSVEKTQQTIYSECETNIKSIYGLWEKQFPPNYKEITFSNEKTECTFDILNNIFDSRPIIEYKNILINLYQSYIEKFGDKVYEIISQYNLKNEVKEILANKKNIQDLILNDNYIVTNLDIILLSQYFDTPVILLSSKGFFENASNIIKTKNSFFYYMIRSPAFYISNLIPKYRLFVDNNNNKVIEYKNVFNYLKSLINDNDTFDVNNFIETYNSKKNIKPKNPTGRLKITASEKINITQPVTLTETIETTPIITKPEIETAVITSDPLSVKPKKIGKLKIMKPK